MLEVTPIRAFYDNYLWLFKQSDSNECGIVDPGDALPVLKFIKENGLTLTVIFVTHHHSDHTGGIERLLQEFDVPVYGPASPNIPSVTHCLAEGDQITIFDITFHVLEIPGHTLDHIAYYSFADNANQPVVFCGDTLFAGGCGRVFEGTHSMMYQSLQKLAQLAADTKVYCAHEYTMANLGFAQVVTPEDAVLASRIAKEQATRADDLPTVPTSISIELATNPFLRCEEEALISAARLHTGQELQQADEVFAAIRHWKDNFQAG